MSLTELGKSFEQFPSLIFANRYWLSQFFVGNIPLLSEKHSIYWVENFKVARNRHF